MPATMGHLFQSLKWCQFDNDISDNETKRAGATSCIGFAAKLIKRMPTEIHIQQRKDIPLRYYECHSHVRSDYTSTTNLSLQLGGMDISLDLTILLPHCIFISFASLCH